MRTRQSSKSAASSKIQTNSRSIPKSTLHEISGLAEETNLTELPLTPFRFYGAPDRDPRGHCLSCVFVTYADPAKVTPVAADDAAATQWHPLDKLPPLAFDHSQILADFLATLR